MSRKIRWIVWLFVMAMAAMALSGCQLFGTADAEGGSQQAEAATDVVETFYEWYVGYPGNPFAERAYRESPLVTETFKSTMDARIEEMIAAGPGGADLVLCAQDFPGAMQYGEAEVADGAATVIVEQVWNPDTEFESVREITVQLEREGDEWLIADIVCPTP